MRYAHYSRYSKNDFLHLCNAFQYVSDDKTFTLTPKSYSLIRDIFGKSLINLLE